MTEVNTSQINGRATKHLKYYNIRDNNVLSIVMLKNAKQKEEKIRVEKKKIVNTFNIHD